MRQPVDFDSPDTFNYTVFDISADGWIGHQLERAEQLARLRSREQTCVLRQDSADGQCGGTRGRSVCAYNRSHLSLAQIRATGSRGSDGITTRFKTLDDPHLMSTLTAHFELVTVHFSQIEFLLSAIFR